MEIRRAPGNHPDARAIEKAAESMKNAVIGFHRITICIKLSIRPADHLVA
jgi:hypothetical protein